VKRVPPNTYRLQRRGGVGIRGMVVREEDALRHMVFTNTHDNILFFTDRGRVFQLRAYQIPEAERTARGTPVINLINLDPQERVTAVVAMAESQGAQYFVMATIHGEIKKVALGDFESVRSSGLIAMDLEPGDELGWVRPAPRGSDIILVSEKGQAVRCRETNVPSRSRGAGGVRSMRLAEGDRVCAMDVVKPNGHLLIVSSGGFAKRTPLSQFPVHNRGGSGVIAMKLSDKSGPVVAAKVVEGNEDVMVISARGTALRTRVSGVSEQGRSAHGVAFMSPGRGDRVACIALVREIDDDAPSPTGRRRRVAQLELPDGEATNGRTNGHVQSLADDVDIDDLEDEDVDDADSIDDEDDEEPEEEEP
jgi:DNA gyrase subunit A